MDIDLTGKRALVCGSSQGIGRAIAEELAKMGASITLFARNRDSLEEVKSALATNASQKHEILIADFSNPDEVMASLKPYLAQRNTIHILINNTGGPKGGPIIGAQTDEFLQAFQSHLVVNHLLTQAVVPGMKQAGFGRIINIISTSVKTPIQGLGVSNTTRGAVASWAKTMANELAEFGITVNNVLPGYTSTARLDSLMQARAKARQVEVSQIEAEIQKEIPAKRFGTAQEVAVAAAFLASPAAAYINGINLPVDGGRTPSL